MTIDVVIEHLVLIGLASDEASVHLVRDTVQKELGRLLTREAATGAFPIRQTTPISRGASISGEARSTPTSLGVAIGQAVYGAMTK